MTTEKKSFAHKQIQREFAVYKGKIIRVSNVGPKSRFECPQYNCKEKDKVECYKRKFFRHKVGCGCNFYRPSPSEGDSHKAAKCIVRYYLESEKGLEYINTCTSKKLVRKLQLGERCDTEIQLSKFKTEFKGEADCSISKGNVLLFIVEVKHESGTEERPVDWVEFSVKDVVEKFRSKSEEPLRTLCKDDCKCKKK